MFKKEDILMEEKIKNLTEEAVALLAELVKTPRVSREEEKATDILENWMKERNLFPIRIGNNLLLVSPDYNPERPTIMLNAHIDTVRPVASWTRDPHQPAREGDRMYGIGTNDCGGGLVSLLQTFRILLSEHRNNNLLFLASCEEEVSGVNGIRKVIPLLPEILHTPLGILEKNITAIVGEPTEMQPAVAEKGLMVLDVVAHGVSGHAARNEGRNAIYEALNDILWFRDYRFEKVSPFLGPVKMSLTIINAGTQHNVVPDECRMTVDIRSNEFYSNEEIFDIVRLNISSEVSARSFHLRSSRISLSHPLIVRAKEMGMEPFGSPTLSDQALMPWQSLKLGPGHSSRSHSADEYICISEISDAIEKYLQLLR